MPNTLKAILLACVILLGFIIYFADAEQRYYQEYRAFQQQVAEKECKPVSAGKFLCKDGTFVQWR